MIFIPMARACPPIPRRSMLSPKRYSASGLASSASSWILRRRTLPARPSRRSKRRCAELPCRVPSRVEPLAVSPLRQRPAADGINLPVAPPADLAPVEQAAAAE